MTTTYDEAVRSSHAEAIQLVGNHVGTPVIAVDEAVDQAGDEEGKGRTAFFGPVISQVPTGEAAARLWDGVLLVASTPGFHELQASPAAAL